MIYSHQLFGRLFCHLFRSLAHECVNIQNRIVLCPLQKMAVNVGSRCEVSMAEPFLNHLQVNACRPRARQPGINKDVSKLNIICQTPCLNLCLLCVQ